MATLHIEHAITDYGVWKTAFDRFAPAREQAGVLGYRVHRPVDDPAYVLIDLEFADDEQAAAFLNFLRTSVWSSAQAAPALVGVAQTRILQLSDQG